MTIVMDGRIHFALRPVATLAAAAMAVSTALVALAPPAQATTIGACGLGSIGVTFTPGLGIELPPNLPLTSVGLIPAQTGTFLCQLSNPDSSEHAQITALSGHVKASCLASSDADLHMTIKWTDRSPTETSSVDIGTFALNTSSASKLVVLAGTVGSGRFRGQTVRMEAVSEGDTSRCATHMFTDTHGPGTIQIS